MYVKDYIIYHQVTLGASDVTATFFQEAVGAAANGYYETNLASVGVLPTPQSFLIKAIAIKFLPNAVIADLQAVLAGWFKFEINDQIEIGPMPICFVPEFNGILAMPDSGSTGTTVPAIGNGANGKNAMVLERPVTISGGQQFKLTCTWPTAPNAKTFWWLLIGDLSGA